MSSCFSVIVTSSMRLKEVFSHFESDSRRQSS